MIDGSQMLDDSTLKFGLLMESAQAHQKAADTQLEELRAHTQDLDGVVRDEIRRTLIEELRMLTSESRRASEVLRNIRHNVSLRGSLWVIGSAIICTAISVATTRWIMPSAPEIASLRLRHDELTASIATLESRGGRIQWKRCGEKARLCVRVDRGAPSYGGKADYYVVEGY